ncbi:hypothetical protein NXS19_009284 [Fusarium pseudograminearum]|nr:hypothetical protein NXS19_009284 [Fusarium pseudograminearum]
MASLRIPALRRLMAAPSRATRAVNQRRWAQVHDIRFLATTQPSQAVVEKYREKLSQKAQQEGLESIDQLKAAYSAKIDAERRKGAVEFPPGTIPQAPETPVIQPNADNPPGQDQPNKDTRDPPASPPKPPPTGADKQAIKTLNDIIDLPKVRELPEKELTAIWRLRHASSEQNLCAVIPTSTYKAMEDAARNAPSSSFPCHTLLKVLRFTSCNGPLTPSPRQALFSSLNSPSTRTEASLRSLTPPLHTTWTLPMTEALFSCRAMSSLTEVLHQTTLSGFSCLSSDSTADGTAKPPS